MAIIFVIMGHVAEKSLNIGDTPFNYFYASFHMPLFMFLSGIFAMKGFEMWNFREAISFIRKKLIRLLLPFFTVGGLYGLTYVSNPLDVYIGKLSCYWFLPALFECMIIAMTAELAIHKLQVTGGGIKLVVHLMSHLFVWAIAIVIYYKTPAKQFPYLLSAVKMYPFFALGIFFHDYPDIRRKLLRSTRMLSIAFIMYLCCLYISTRISIPINIPAFFSVFLLVSLFSMNDTRISDRLSLVGRYSLQIYVFHWFFLPSLDKWGVAIKELSMPASVLDDDNFILLFFITLLFAVPITVLCICISKIIEHTNWINKIIFG